MAGSKAAWGIEVGSFAVKAIRLERSGEQIMVSDFGEFPHKRPLSTPDLDVDEMIRLTLGTLSSQKNLEKDPIVMSVEGRSSLPRFAKLPPVEEKKIPDIIQFEAAQQIPFPIEEVEWDAKKFVSEDSPETEVGIFAIKKDVLDHRLAIWSEHGLDPSTVTLGPVAIFNAVHFDLAGGQNKPFVVLDIGTKASDLVVVDGDKCWIRTFPIGGSDFTEAIMEAFKLPYPKAEKLKQESASSKYAKQIMQAMRPVFGDLLQDVQRSISHYENMNRGTKIETVLGVGSTFKIPGLRKFLGQQLNLNVARFDEFRRIQVEGRMASDFASHGVSMATAYGLALQGIGEAEIEVNLAPTEVVRDLAWASKTKWFVAAAGIALVASGMMFIKPFSAQTAMGAESIAGASEVESVVRLAKKNKSDLDRISADANIGFSSTNLERLLDDREVWPHLVTDAMNAVASAGPQPELLGSDIEKIKAIDPAKRKLVLLEDFGATYSPSEDGRFLDVEMQVAFSNDDERGFVNDTIGRFINDLAASGTRDGVPYVVVPGSFSSNPGDLQIVKVTDTGENEVSGGASSSRAANAGKKAGRDANRGSGRGTGRGGQAGGPTGTGFAAGGGAGQPGKNKSRSGEKINPDADPTGGGFASSGGGFTGGSRGGFGGGDQDGGNGFGDAGNRRPGQRVDDKVDFVDLATDAAIPGEPSLYSPGDVFHIGRVTFRVKLNEG
ncbi:type IV pilus assembly protein PilM [bacterium]|nr:type IV pilus assembly protein PilM [bacterium]